MKHYVVCENKCLIESYTKKEIGDIEELKTTADTIVSAINEVHDERDSVFIDVGNVAELQTNDKIVVSAINEVHSEHDVLAGNVGQVAELKTTEKTVVGAINEVHDELDGLSGNVGDVTGLNTVSQNVVGAINETLAMVQGGIDNIFDVIYPVGSLYWSSKPTNPAELFGGTWTQIKDKFVLTAGDTYTAGATGGNANTTLEVANLPSHSHSFTPKGSVSAHSHGLNNHTHSFSGSASHSHDVIYNNHAGTDFVYWFSGQTNGVKGNAVTGDSGREHTDATGSIITDSKTVTISGTTGKASGSTANATPTFTGTTGVTGDTGSGTAFSNMPPYVVKYCWERTA